MPILRGEFYMIKELQIWVHRAVQPGVKIHLPYLSINLSHGKLTSAMVEIFDGMYAEQSTSSFDIALNWRGSFQSFEMPQLLCDPKFNTAFLEAVHELHPGIHSCIMCPCSKFH